MSFYPSNLRNRWMLFRKFTGSLSSIRWISWKRKDRFTIIFSVLLSLCTTCLIKCFFQPRKWDFILPSKFICMGIEIKRFMLGFVYFVNFGAWRKVVARELSFWIFKLRLLIWSILGTWVLVCFPNQHPFDGEVRNFQF